MRLNEERVKALQKLLKEQFNLVYTEEEVQQAGLAIMRFVIAKEFRKQEHRIDHKQRKKDGRVIS